MATDIVERLHDFDMRREFSHVRNPDICGEAADVIAALRARVAEEEEKRVRQLRQQGDAWAADARRKDARIAELEAVLQRIVRAGEDLILEARLAGNKEAQ